MRFKTNILKEALDWVVKNWEESEWYNLNMNKVGESKAPKWFTDFVVNSFNPLARDVATLKQDMIEVKKDIVEIKQRLTKVEQRLSVIESLPTIQRELKLKKSN